MTCTVFRGDWLRLLGRRWRRSRSVTWLSRLPRSSWRRGGKARVGVCDYGLCSAALRDASYHSLFPRNAVGRACSQQWLEDGFHRQEHASSPFFWLDGCLLLLLQKSDNLLWWKGCMVSVDTTEFLMETLCPRQGVRGAFPYLRADAYARCGQLRVPGSRRRACRTLGAVHREAR